ncbi:hypothetical protein MKK70_22865 [Methylobacterium sp. E-041]|uniref:hypothetical protein n=1 Tax=Methylobacterium sp. E-041 TaxID=2836573 RepID=UPI001FBA33C3|nr:hypothetical protein [Methylobacterium sp. E-041]MCJ2108164.1 hypothetical protein [Methylobacterium sp. E-041]
MAPAITCKTAPANGRFERAIQRNAERGKRIAEPALAAASGTPLDKGLYLDALKKVPAEPKACETSRRLSVFHATSEWARPPTFAGDPTADKNQIRLFCKRLIGCRFFAYLCMVRSLIVCVVGTSAGSPLAARIIKIHEG